MDHIIFFVNTAVDDISAAINVFNRDTSVKVDSSALDTAIVSLESAIRELRLKAERSHDSII